LLPDWKEKAIYEYECCLKLSKEDQAENHVRTLLALAQLDKNEENKETTLSWYIKALEASLNCKRGNHQVVKFIDSDRTRTMLRNDKWLGSIDA
jgi:hypothetical protein